MYAVWGVEDRIARVTTLTVLAVVVFFVSGDAFVGGTWSQIVLSVLTAGFVYGAVGELGIIGALIVTIAAWPVRRFTASTLRG